MAKRRRLVTNHLENVSGRVLEDYPNAVRNLIRRRSGVYALYRHDKLYYVGLASNLMARLKQHTRDRHKRAWDRFSVYLTVHDEHMKELEALLLRLATPPGNKVRGRFMGSRNIWGQLNQGMKDRDADHRASLLGGPAARRRRRTKAARGFGSKALAGAVDRSCRLKGTLGEYEYRASLRRDGTISYAGEVYDSPRAAAIAALGRPANGWTFWRFKNRKGEWVRLREMKK